jgi:hypothetical protein
MRFLPISSFEDEKWKALALSVTVNEPIAQQVKSHSVRPVAEKTLDILTELCPILSFNLCVVHYRWTLYTALSHVRKAAKAV